MLKKAILIVTAATFAPTGSFADHIYTIGVGRIDNTPYKSQHIEIARICGDSITISAGGAEAGIPLDGSSQGPINGVGSDTGWSLVGQYDIRHDQNC